MEVLTKIFDDHGVKYRTNERSFILDCPKCGKSGHLYVFRSTGFGKCMRCGEKFTPSGLVAGTTGVSHFEANHLLGTANWRGADPGALDGNLNAPKWAVPEDELLPIPIPGSFSNVTEADAKLGMDYLESRGVSVKDAIEHGLMYSASMQRVIIPITDRNGDWVGWQGRDITGKADLKILFPKGFDKSKSLLGYHEVGSSDHVILCEGPFDFMKLAPLGGAICTFGKDISLYQLQLIQDLPVARVYLGLDPDAFALVDRYAAFLTPKQDVWLIQPPAHRKDFGECTDKEVLEAFQNAGPYVKGERVSSAVLRER